MTDQSKESSAIDHRAFQLERWIEHLERTSSISEVAKYAEDQRIRADKAEQERDVMFEKIKINMYVLQESTGALTFDKIAEMLNMILEEGSNTDAKRD